MEVPAEGYIKKRLMSFACEKAPHIILICMLVPFQNREYEYGLLNLRSFFMKITMDSSISY